MENRADNNFNSPENRFSDPFKPQGIPQGLKVLTILSIIGCVFQFISAAVNFAFAKSFYNIQQKQLEAAQSQDLPSWAKRMMPDPEMARQVMEKTFDNRLPIFILSMIAAGLCFYGVLKMRKLNRQGFPFYVVGELLPFITSALFIGVDTIKGFWGLAMVGISLLFILLYAANLGKMKSEE